MNETILVVDDEKEIADLVELYLSNEGYRVEKFYEALPALDYTRREEPALAVLDVMLPDIDGFAVCQALRKKGGMPILFLSARSAEEDRLRGYGLGADDYMTKPFSQAELFAKVAALLRRSKGLAGRQVLASGGVALDVPAHAVTVDGVRVDLAPKEIALLRLLLEQQGQVLRREDLLLRLWGWDYEGSDRVVDSHIRQLRRALGPWARCIRTVFKTGYKWEAVPPDGGDAT